MIPARLILDSAAAGGWNMAVDQALLESADATGQVTVRFYSWLQPTLSLGYFQAASDRRLHPSSTKCALVRRSTGGGAILHDRELTYSICVPSENRWSVEHESLYWTMHGLIVELLAEYGVLAELFREAAGTQSQSAGSISLLRSQTNPTAQDSAEKTIHSDPKAFLCFQRRTPGDVTLAGYKICGSAQRRKKNALLQHGSLLVAQSPAAPELPGIADLGLTFETGQTSKFLQRWVVTVGERLGLELKAGQLSPAEHKAAVAIANEFYDNPVWTGKR